MDLTATPSDGNYVVRHGHYYAVRTKEHRLVETGEFGEDGTKYVDHHLDRTNPAATIPVHLENTDGPTF